MTNIIEFNEFSPSSGSAEFYCWLCQKAASPRALFCHHCGTIQPARELDHFARLGLERRVDVDPGLLDRQYAALRRTLDPGRFAVRGMGERGHAARQLQALDEAYETLRDPLRRGRYWLTLHQQEFEAAVAAHPLVAELAEDLESADDPALCDRVAQRAGQAMEESILGFLQALRQQDWEQATQVLAELDGLETILGAVRERRARFAVPITNGSYFGTRHERD